MQAPANRVAAAALPIAACLRSGTSQWRYIEILLNMYAKISMHRAGLLTFSWSILCFVFSANTHSAEGKPRNRKFARINKCISISINGLKSL